MVNKIKMIPTGLFKLDKMIGGGIPEGRILEIFGFPHSGKTTLSLEISKIFKKTKYIDFEWETDPVYHKAIGAKVEVIQPMVWETAMDDLFREIVGISKNTVKTLEKKTRSKAPFQGIIIDSIGSALTNEQVEKELKDNTVGALAGAVTRWCRKAEKIYKAFGVTCLALNHRKKEIGGFAGEYTPGGVQLKHSAAVRLALHSAKCKVPGFEDGRVMTIKQVKNKVAANREGQTCEYLINPDRGIVRGYEAFQVGLECGIVKQSGQSYKIGSKSLKGRAAMINFLDESEELRKRIYEQYETK